MENPIRLCDRARMSLRMLYRVPVIDDALHGFDHILKIVALLLQPHTVRNLDHDRVLFRPPSVRLHLIHKFSLEALCYLATLRQLFGEPERVNSFETIGDYEVVPRPMVPAFTLTDEAGLQATAGYLQRERCLSQLGNMRCAR
jgi:hypothetical protein